LRQYASEHGFEIVREFEEAETAKSTGRTQFNQMLAFLRNPKNNCRTVLVEKTDRLYRNLKDWVVIDELEVEIHFVKEGEITSANAHSSKNSRTVSKS
jgi:DNA invertase Pin-like site-specific DNA recombinase